MSKIKYLFSRLFHMDFSNLKETINNVKKINHKNKLIIFFDIVWCGFRYGAGYTDYISFGFYALNKKQRKTYLTRSKNNQLVATLNPKEKRPLFDSKKDFNEKYNRYLKRDWIYLDNNEEQFKEWIKKHKTIIAKPNDDQGGHGVEKITVSDYQTSHELYEYLVKKNARLVEEVIQQCDELNKVYPNSVNTIRAITILNNDKVSIVTCFLRIGNGGFVDNTCSGGMLTIIDPKTGITLYDACDGNLNIYRKHPITKTELIGVQIPFWKETVELLDSISRVTPEIRYIGWDVAITPTGPVIVEGNPYPGYYYQFLVHCPTKTGILPRIEEIMKGR